MSLILNPHRFAVPSGGGGSAPTLSAMTAKGEGSSATVSFSGVVAEDFLMIGAEYAGASPTPSTPAGWTKLAQTPVGDTWSGTPGQNTSLIVFYKIATGSESSVVIGPASDHVVAFGHIWKGVDAANPINDAVTTQYGSNFHSHVATGVTTTVDNTAIVGWCANYWDEYTLDSLVNSNLSDLVVDKNEATALGNRGLIASWHGTLANAGASGITNQIFPSGGIVASVKIALAPA